MTAIQDVADKYIPRFMSGLMARDWEKVKSALVLTAQEYHELNGLGLHKGIYEISAIQSDDAAAVASAVLWAIQRESNVVAG